MKFQELSEAALQEGPNDFGEGALEETPMVFQEFGEGAWKTGPCTFKSSPRVPKNSACGNLGTSCDVMDCGTRGGTN